MTEDEKWWGYIHVNGNIQVKRYFGADDLYDAEESPFVREVFGPFKSSGREEALKVLAEKQKRLWDKNKL